MQDMEIRIIRSARRRRTVQARVTPTGIEVLAPAGLGQAELQEHVTRLVERLRRRRARQALNDRDLECRAAELNRRYFGGRLRWESITWTDRQRKRFGSCCTERATIRIATRLAGMPRFVLDYVLVHELAHLLEPNHGPRFWAHVMRYPRTERARGYLMAVGLEDLEVADAV